MEVHLVSYTPDALNLLLATKGTRLAHGAIRRHGPRSSARSISAT
jgi:hypothetical protein